MVYETSRNYLHVTEKTFNAIANNQMFIINGQANSLDLLKSLGYKTFDSIIDESYDAIADDTQRWSCAMQEVKRLSTIDQTEILEKIKPIAEYNYGLISAKNWYKTTLTQLADEIDDFLQNQQIQVVTLKLQRLL